MFGQIKDAMYLTKGEKAFILAYGAVMAVTAGITILIMSGVEGRGALPTEPSFYTLWVIAAGALSGGIGLFVARGWMGRSGALGLGRALVGCVAIAFVASVVAGTLIQPLNGTFYAPVLLLTEFIDKIWLAVAWIAVVLGAHHLMTVLADERALGYGRAAKATAVSQLSSLSRAQLYHRK